MNIANFLPSQSVKSEHPWIDASKFEPHSQADVLEGVIARVREESRLRIRGGGKPVKVVFDLDGTIFDVKPRSLRILKEFALSKKARDISTDIASWALGLEAFQLLYTLGESAAANKVPGSPDQVNAFLKEAFHFWKERFFTQHYLTFDHPTAGAVDYVNRVVDSGGIAVYLTGRDWPGMGRGTLTMLEHFGFPTSPRATESILKPNAGLDDAEFKDEALRELRIEGNAVALFDNEPANFHVFEKNFPEAWLVFFHSNCSDKDARTVKRIYRVGSFLS
jgi:hypothetical protein